MRSTTRVTARRNMSFAWRSTHGYGVFGYPSTFLAQTNSWSASAYGTDVWVGPAGRLLSMSFSSPDACSSSTHVVNSESIFRVCAFICELLVLYKVPPGRGMYTMITLIILYICTRSAPPNGYNLVSGGPVCPNEMTTPTDFSAPSTCKTYCDEASYCYGYAESEGCKLILSISDGMCTNSVVMTYYHKIEPYVVRLRRSKRIPIPQVHDDSGPNGAPNKGPNEVPNGAPNEGPNGGPNGGRRINSARRRGHRCGCRGSSGVLRWSAVELCIREV